MKMAVFFQKHGRSRVLNILKMLYIKVFLHSDSSKVCFLRDSGAKLGENVHISNVEQLGTEPCLVEIGNNVYISGSETQFLTHDGGISCTYEMGIAPKKYDCFGKIRIGDNCFIGIKCIIMKGVTIGDNCIIGAGSIVTKDIPAGSVACGIPARVIGTVEEYYEKNKDFLDDTIGWNTYKKRIYLEKKYNKASSQLPEKKK